MTRIPWPDLPATFQDAVEFTRHLGIGYLWIDSICIIQGDEADWNHESANMLDIYRNAYVTLAGLHGSSSLSGLHSFEKEEQPVKVAELSRGQHMYPIYMRVPHVEPLCEFYPGNFLHFENHQSAIPLVNRAWTYQERMISRAILYFTGNEIVFQCFETMHCQCRVSRYESQIKESSKTLFLLNTLYDQGGDNFGMPIPTSKTYRSHKKTVDGIAGCWRDNILPEYSQLSLTLPRDRLPALGALAKQFHKACPTNTYLAGLWLKSLLHDLLWVCAHNPLGDFKLESKETLNRPYSIPTWSWASLQSSITYVSAESLVPRAEVIQASCKYQQDNPFGILESSLLVLRGKLMPCLADWTGSVDCSIQLLATTRTSLRDDERNIVKAQNLSGTTYMDHDDTGCQCIPPLQDVYILQIAKVQWGDRGRSFYLVLRRIAEGKDVFERAGVYCDIPGLRSDARSTAFSEQGVVTDCEIR
ncbi:hypothetical protein M426DRAFT_233951 [Hypoxylon sp. CI-4A]|nr:hypothetical protein M426DRAFT_233951 [Hypoxylon sp. CI-4A]